MKLTHEQTLETTPEPLPVRTAPAPPIPEGFRFPPARTGGTLSASVTARPLPPKALAITDTMKRGLVGIGLGLLVTASGLGLLATTIAQAPPAQVDGAEKSIKSLEPGAVMTVLPGEVAPAYRGVKFLNDPTAPGSVLVAGSGYGGFGSSYRVTPKVGGALEIQRTEALPAEPAFSPGNTILLFGGGLFGAAVMALGVLELTLRALRARRAEVRLGPYGIRHAQVEEVP